MLALLCHTGEKIKIKNHHTLVFFLELHHTYHIFTHSLSCKQVAYNDRLYCGCLDSEKNVYVVCVKSFLEPEQKYMHSLCGVRLQTLHGQSKKEKIDGASRTYPISPFSLPGRDSLPHTFSCLHRLTLSARAIA